MADEEALGIVCGGCTRFLDFDDGVFATRDDETLGILARGSDKGEGVDIFMSLGRYRGVESRVLCRPAPDANCVVSRSGDHYVWSWKADSADLRRRPLLA